MNMQDAIQAIESIVKLRPGMPAEILDLVEAVLAERREYARRVAAEMAGVFARYLREEFEPWQNETST